MVYVVILEKKPAHKAAEQLLTLRSEADGFAILGREVFALRRSREDSMSSNNMVEKNTGDCRYDAQPDDLQKAGGEIRPDPSFVTVPGPAR